MKKRLLFICLFIISCNTSTNENKTLDKWIAQAEFGLLWFLVIKVTRKGSFILFRKDISNKFLYKNYLLYKQKYVITDYRKFWNNNEDAIRRLNEDTTIEL